MQATAAGSGSEFVYTQCNCFLGSHVSAGDPPYSQRTGDQRFNDMSNGIFGCEDPVAPMMDNGPTAYKKREWCSKPQGGCPFGYYMSDLITYDSCASASGNKLVGFAKQSMVAGDPWDTFPSVLTMIKGLQNFEVRMDCSEDFDVLIGYEGYTGPNGEDCVVGRDCTFDRDGTANRIEACTTGATSGYLGPVDGPWCIDENDLQNTNSPASSTWYFSGATEGNPVCMERFAAQSLALRDYIMKIFPTQSAYATLTYQFSEISPCPQLPPTATCTRNEDIDPADDPNAVAEATGDPHMRNLNGEIFDLSQEGEHVLIRIPEETGAKLEVVGTVTTFHKERKCPVFFLTKLRIQGDLVGEVPLEIVASQSLFGVKQGSEFMNLNLEEPVVVGESKVQICDENNHVCRTTSPKRRTAKYPDKLLVSLPSMAIVASNYPSANPSFLNLAVSGLPSQKNVGGLLGHGDHSHVTAEDETCRKSKSLKRKVSMLQKSAFSSTVGHIR
jgi:hypothetical protein